MSVYSPVMAREAHAGSFLPTDRFEIDQYVRVFLTNGRTEIGQVTSFKDDKVVVTTLHGYDYMVSPRNIKRAFLLVLDLNGVLVARGKGAFVHRPYVAEFMKFVFSNFAVAVWTSGLERSSNPIIESVFAGYQDRLLFTMYRDACRPRPTEDNPWGTIKDLQVIFSRYPKSFHSVNTIIVDDSPDKCSHPDIALCPVPFKDPQAQMDDDGLKKAIAVLEEVLVVESHAPVIRAAEERLEAIRAAAAQEDGQSPALLHKLASAMAPATQSQQSAQSWNSENRLAEVDLWKTRLCCDYLRGHCHYGEECRYSHDEDDHVRPCSRKNKCHYGHANRWVHTDGDDLLEKMRQHRARHNDASDAYFLSERELKEVGQSGRVHTGIPAEDARLEREERERAVRTSGDRQAAIGGPVQPASIAPTLLFSTDPNRNRALPVGSSSSSDPFGANGPVSIRVGGAHLHQPQGQFQYAHQQQHQQQQRTGQPQPRAQRSANSNTNSSSSLHIGERSAYMSERDGARGTGWYGAAEPPHPGQQIQFQNSQQNQRASQRPNTGRVVHLVGSSLDATALVRQLQALESQENRV